MRPFYEPPPSGLLGLLDPKFGHLGSKMLEIGHMSPVQAQTWIPDEPTGGREDVILTAAELAECTCPDPCECDHDN
jgi:hypothetical protein